MATSDSAAGGFVTLYQGPDHAAQCTCCSYQGDFTLFVDKGGTSGYVVVRHNGFFCIELLDDTFTRGTGKVAHVPMVLSNRTGAVPGDESPVLFRRHDTYYLLEASGCCGCKGGSTIWALTASHPLGPYSLQGNVGEAADGSPVTKAQQRTVFPVAAPNGGTTFVHVGNNFVPGAGGVGTRANAGLLYWYPLAFGADGALEPLQWRDEVTFEMARPRAEDADVAVWR